MAHLIKSHHQRLLFIYAAIAVMSFTTYIKAAKAQTPFLVSPYYFTTTPTQNFSAAHPAYDYPLLYTQVLAADMGTVTRVQWYNNDPGCHGPINLEDCGYGLHVYIQHSNGYVSRYGHLSAAAFALNSTGATVQAGQVIGTSGNTGWSTGPHLHFEVKNASGGNVDPNNPNLWKDGQWATVSRPLPKPVNGGEIFIDDNTTNTGGFSKGNGGHFHNSCPGNNCANWIFDNNMYYTLVNGNTEDSWARWQPSGIPNGGAIYEIFVYIPNVTANTTSWQAAYGIIHAEGTSSAVIDQLGSRGQWISIGAYRMLPDLDHSVYLIDATGEFIGTHCGNNQYCRVGADSVRFVRRGTTYVPDFRYTTNSWDTKLTLRNNGGGVSKNVVRFLLAGGSNLACTSDYTYLPAHGVITYSCPNGNVASAIVDSTQDLAVVVTHERNNKRERSSYNGLRPSGSLIPSDNSGAPGWEKIHDNLYAPNIKRAYFGRSSTIYILNAGTQATTVQVNFYSDAGVLRDGGSYPLNPGQRHPVASSNGIIAVGGCDAAGTICSAHISSNNAQPLAAVVSESNDGSNNSPITHNIFRVGVSPLYFPVVKHKFVNNSTGLRIQNTSTFNTDVAVSYYNQDGSFKCALNPVTLATRAANTFATNDNCPGIGFLGSVIATTNNNAALVGMANEASQNGVYKKDYAAYLVGSRNLYGALVYRGYIDTTYQYTWNAGIGVQNVTSSPATVRLLYYDVSGVPAIGNPQTVSIPAFGMTAITPQPNNFAGSVIIVSDQNVTAMLNVINSATISDTHASYNASTR